MQRFFLLMLLVAIVSLAWATEDAEYVKVFAFKDLPQPSESEGVGIAENKLQVLPGYQKGYWISEEVRTETNFNAVSVSWLGIMPIQSELTILVRTLDLSGVWTDWQPAQGFDSDLQFLGQNMAYQFQVQLANNSESKSPQIFQITMAYNYIYEGRFGAGIVTETFEPLRAVSKPSIVSRSGWGARAPSGSYSSHTPQKITVHHTWRPTAAQYNGASTIRSIQDYHMDTNGWSDIGYHFLIGTYPSSGETAIYQGRPETVIGAHTGGANTNNVGVNVVGDYTTESVHKNSYQALVKLLGWLCSQYKISPNNIYGHRDLGSSACPGDILYNKLPQLRTDVKNYIDNGGGNDETGKLVGVIYNASEGTSSKISGAVVKLSSGHSMTTGTDGLYSFQIKVGTYQITVQKTGYQSASSSDTVKTGETTWESIGLKK